MVKECKHFWFNSNTRLINSFGQSGTLICSNCLSVCKFEQENEDSPINIISIKKPIKKGRGDER